MLKFFRGILAELQFLGYEGPTGSLSIPEDTHQCRMEDRAQTAGVFLQLHLLDDSETSCTKSVGTDLSMDDIRTLQAEVWRLRNAIAVLEGKLSQRAETLSKEEVEDGPILCSVCKAKLNHTQAQNSELTAGDQSSLQVEEEEGVSSVNPECEAEVSSVFIPDSVGQSEQQDGASLSLQCYTDPNPTEGVESSCTAAAQTPLKTCSVRLEDCRTMMELSGRSDGDGSDREDNDFVPSGDDENWSPLSEDNRRRNRNPSEHRSHPSGGLQAPEEVRRREKLFTCSQCEKRFATSRSLAMHVKRHKKNLHCEECGKGFVTRKELKLHVTRHTGTREFTCHICGKHFADSSRLSVHLKTHTEEKPFGCNECTKSFRTKGTLTLHLRTHTGEWPFRCSYCSSAFSHGTHLKLHERIHTNEKPFKCSHCEKTFARSESLKAHERVHTDQRPFRCPHCGKTFRQRTHLLCHKRSHTGEKPYLCADCGKRFSDSTHFREHRRIHTGERPFRCAACGKGFSKKNTLRQHEKTHTGEKPYTCPQCGKAFARPCVLRTHQRIHSGEKPYRCSICGHTFAFLSSLNKHKLKHTVDSPLDS
ncbi:gastrula zinc finger protein XlCGF57.1-like isoform X2 [Pygocentrus nattereri]|uniref:gastrula zinc finger protein XlCGF57.1-like isoform X2 n=1 Tax=Pygocentrus nattereri TaxID=42514 RepID=UPI001890B6A7|nr:gastrula zinc finger protein XlCGF57.1-like isoform X2 [Pygocentrus nattereri]